MKRSPILAAVGVWFLVLCAYALCQEDQGEVLRTIIEKAREREGALDAMDMQYSGTAAWAEALVPVGAAFEGRYLKSQERYRHDVRARIKRYGVEQSDNANFVSDGQTITMLYEQPDDSYVTMSAKQNEGFWDWIPTPEDVGMTRLFGTPGTLSEFLEADTGKLSEKYGDRFTAPDAIMRTAVRGRETVRERECVVVECSVDPADGSPETVHRLYFAEDLNYACVKFEAGRPTDEGLNLMYSATLDGFREVMPGIFLPFAASANTFSENAQPQMTVECKLESIEFPKYFDEDAFALVFPDGTRVDDLEGVSYVDNMLFEMAAEAIAAEQTPAAPVVEPTGPVAPPPPAPPVESVEEKRSGTPILLAVLAAVLVIAGAVAAVMAARRRRR